MSMKSESTKNFTEIRTYRKITVKKLWPFSYFFHKTYPFVMDILLGNNKGAGNTYTPPPPYTHQTCNRRLGNQIMMS